MPPPSPTAELEIGLYRLDANRYSVELRSRSPDNDADMAPVRGTTTFDFEKLRLAEWDGAEAIGLALAERLFSDPAVMEHYQRACTAAEAVDAVLRVRLFIGPTAPELHALPWELLIDPRTGKPLATRERVLFSRYLSSHDWRPVRLRRQESLRALVAIANPSDLGQFKMAKVDVEGEWERARAALGEILPVKVTGPGTFSQMVDRLREEFDILYLVAHGALSKGEPILWLEDAEGTSDRRAGRDMLSLNEMARPPRLVVLASCQSGDMEATACDGEALVALGPRLAEAGIPAVIAMQGKVSMETVERFMLVFFRELCRDGQIDRAMAAARFAVKDRPDVASPVLFLRLTSGRIWYVPGFARGADQEFDLWPGLLEYLEPRRPKATPVLGSGLLEPYVGSTRDFARRWANWNQFPLALHEQEDLPRVAQYLSISLKQEALESRFEKELILALTRNLGRDFVAQSARSSAADLLAAAGAHRRLERPTDPHRVLAELPFPIYLTANPDRLLMDALLEAEKCPEIGICPWTDEVEHSDSIFVRDPDFSPTVERPLVFYLFGRLEDCNSLVLTEDDYFDYLIGLTRNNERIPAIVRRALVDSALFFLGFRLDDWDFRVLLRSLMGQGGRERRKRFRHVAAQIDPEDGRNLDPAGARRYLQRYFNEAEIDIKIDIYWGHVDDFCRELWDRTRHFTAASKGPRP
ncbi:MAG: CHAT domain-containing protein [Isosphaeraceae bacterium]